MPNYAHRDRQQEDAASSRPHFARYAVFYTPKPGTALAAFGRSWFGRANDGVTLQAFSDAGLNGTSFARLASAPGRYTGLHALIRSPFTPREGIGLDAIKTRLINFARRRKPLATGPLTLSRAGRFLVLRPVEATPGARMARRPMRRLFRGFRSVAERHRTRGARQSQSERLSAPAPGELRRPPCAERVSLLDHADRPLGHRASRTSDASALARARRDLRLGRHRRCSLAVRRQRGGRAPTRLIGRYRLGA